MSRILHRNLITDPALIVDPLDNVYVGSYTTLAQNRNLDAKQYGFSVDGAYHAKGTPSAAPPNNIFFYPFGHWAHLPGAGGARVQSGKRYGCRFRYRLFSSPSAGTLAVGYIAADVAGGVLGANEYVTLAFPQPLGMTEFVIVTDPLPAGAYTLGPRFNVFNTPSGETIDAYIAEFLVVELPAGSTNADVPPFFTGDDLNASWEGTPALSTSILQTDTVGDRLYEALLPVAEPYDAVRGYPLRTYASGIGSMFQPIENLVRDLDQLVDPDSMPVSWLPWLGQFVGQSLSPPGPAERSDDYRNRVTPLIKDPPHRRRGTLTAIVEEVQSFLNPPRTVYVTERQGGNARIGALGVIAAEYKSGTTLAKIQARVNAIKPAGRLITVSEVSGLNWQSLRDTHTDWNDVRSTFVDWNEVRTNPTKQ